MTLPCLVLAGGLGTRMRPATETLPKALIEVRGRPFADLQMEWLAAQGVAEVVYCIGYLGGMLRERLDGGARFGLRIDYVDEGTELRGTAGALRLAAEQGKLPDAFFVLYGDSYLTVDLAAVEAAWRAGDAPALMTVLHNCDRWDTSNAEVRDGRVVVYQKGGKGMDGNRLQWIDYGLSVLTRDVVVGRLAAGEKGDLAVMMRDLAAEGRLAAYEVSDRFYEVGSPQGLRDLEGRLSR